MNTPGFGSVIFGPVSIFSIRIGSKFCASMLISFGWMILTCSPSSASSPVLFHVSGNRRRSCVSPSYSSECKMYDVLAFQFASVATHSTLPSSCSMRNCALKAGGVSPCFFGCCNHCSGVEYHPGASSTSSQFCPAPNIDVTSYVWYSTLSRYSVHPGAIKSLLTRLPFRKISLVPSAVAYSRADFTPAAPGVFPASNDFHNTFTESGIHGFSTGVSSGPFFCTQTTAFFHPLSSNSFFSQPVGGPAKGPLSTG